MPCIRFTISGRVQGVFYRATVQRRARELGITGHAHNLPDGRVQVFACGEAEAVRAFGEWLWVGSSASRVTDVAAEPAGDQSPRDFTTG
jgi:acylphosphatase